MAGVRVLGTTWRRRIALAVVVALTALAGYASWQAAGVYTARTTITLMPPPNWSAAGNTFTESAASTVGFARVIEETYNGGERGQLFIDPETRLHEAGITEDETVFVPDYGGQWAANFNQPALVIDVVGEDPADVQRRTAEIADSLEEIIEEKQDEWSVAEDQRITWYSTPEPPVAHYAAPQRVRAAGGVALLGILACAVIVLAGGHTRPAGSRQGA